MPSWHPHCTSLPEAPAAKRPPKTCEPHQDQRRVPLGLQMDGEMKYLGRAVICRAAEPMGDVVTEKISHCKGMNQPVPACNAFLSPPLSCGQTLARSISFLPIPLHPQGSTDRLFVSDAAVINLAYCDRGSPWDWEMS